MNKRKLLMCSFLLLLISFMLSSIGNCLAWTNAQMLSLPSEPYVKNPRIWPAASGGFHAAYRRYEPQPLSIMYRRYQAGVLTGPVNVYAGPLYNGNYVCEAGNGDIWITYENWLDWSTYGGEDIWAARSTDGGATWTYHQVTDYVTSQDDDGQAKNPEIVPYGPANSATVMSLSWRAVENYLCANHWNGSAWTGNYNIGTYTDNSYGAHGSCRSLADGSVYRTYSREINNAWQICYRRFNGVGWEPEVVVSTNGSGPFASRPDIAVNEYGQIMVIWDQDSYVYARFFDGTGWGPQTQVDAGYTAAVTAIPGRQDFYLVYPGTMGAWNHCAGRRFLNGYWYPKDVVSQGQPFDYTPWVDVCAGNDGTIYACWEYWGTGSAQHWFSICYDFSDPDTTPPSAPAWVADDGDVTNVATSLHATWAQASDPETGIDYYEYSIGTSPGATDVVGWTNNGGSTEVTHFLQLTSGVTYYFNVRAYNKAGLAGAVTSSDGITCIIVQNNVYFSPVQTLSNTGYPSDTPMLAQSADGGMHLVWHENAGSLHRILYRKLTGSAWSAIEYVTSGSPSSFYPDVVEDASGNVHLIFANPGGRENNDIYESIRVSSGWGTPVKITSGASMCWYPKLASGYGSSQVRYIANGDNSSYTVKSAVRSSMGWLAPVNVGSGAYASQRYGIPDVATNTSGEAYAVWTNSNRQVIFAKTVNGNWTTPAVIASHSTGFICHPRIDVGPDGLAHVVYADHSGDSDAFLYYIKQTGSSSWSAKESIGNGFYPDVVVDLDNQPHVVYGKAVTSNDVFHKFRRSSGWSQEQNLSNNSGASERPALCLDTQGNIHVAWQDNTGGNMRIMHRKSTKPDLCGNIRSYSDGTSVALLGKVVTAIFADRSCIFIQEPNRTSGIRVIYSGTSVAVGDRVDVTGSVMTWKPDGSTPAERYIAYGNVIKISSGEEPKPLAMNCRAIGGGPVGNTLAGVAEGTGEVGVGLNNIGLLVKIAGKVTKVDGSYIYVDDGSDIQDISDATGYVTGVMVRCASTPSVTVGDIVSVAGIVEGSVPSGWSANRRYIRCRTAGDLVLLSSGS